MIFLIAPLVCHAQTQQPTTRDKFSAREVKEDFAYLYKTLEASHYDLYVNTNKRAFDRKFERINKSIKGPLNLLEINRLFQPFVALSKLAHCSLGFPYGGYNQHLKNNGTLLPFEVVISNQRAFVAGNHSEQKSIEKGDEILTIDSVPIKSRLKRIYNYLSGHNDSFKNTFIDLLTFPRIYWAVFDQKGAYKIRIKKKSGEIRVFDVKSVLASDFEKSQGNRKPIFNTSREFKFIGKVAYLRPGLFLNIEAKEMNTSDHKTFETDEFVKFIDSSFSSIHKKKTKNLILDLRGNPGGDNKFSDVMIAYFADKPFRFFSRFLVKTSEITKAFWKDVNDPLLADMKENILIKKNGERFEVAMEKYPPRTDALKFAGNVYVLINRYSYSNAVATAAIIQDYGFGKLIGEQTADVPTSYGAVHQFKLPNTQIAVTYPKALIVRPNGDKSLNGVMPDFTVHDDIATDEDEILKFTLKLVVVSRE